MTALRNYTANDIAALPTPALLAIYNEITGKQTKKFARRADAERQAIRAMTAAGRIVEASEVQDGAAAQGEQVVADEPATAQPKPARVRHRPLLLADQRPAVAAASALVKVTANEGRLLTNIARNLMTGLNGAEPACADEAQCWANQLNDGPYNIPERSLPGLMASLVKKGLATTNGEGCGLTEAGFAAYKALPSPLLSEAQGKAGEKPAVAVASASAPGKSERGALLASVLAAFRAHFASGAESVNLKELAPKIGISERTLRQAMDAAKRKGFVFPSLGKCCFGFVEPGAKAKPKKG